MFGSLCVCGLGVVVWLCCVSWLYFLGGGVVFCCDCVVIFSDCVLRCLGLCSWVVFLVAVLCFSIVFVLCVSMIVLCFSFVFLVLFPVTFVFQCCSLVLCYSVTVLCFRVVFLGYVFQ